MAGASSLSGESNLHGLFVHDGIQKRTPSWTAPRLLDGDLADHPGVRRAVVQKGAGFVERQTRIGQAAVAAALERVKDRFRPGSVGW